MLYVKSVAADGYKVQGEEGRIELTCAEAAAVTEKTVTFDLTNIDDFSKWGNSYGSHTVTKDEANIIFAAASKQTTNITDCPVTKGSDIEVVLNNSKAQITAITITLKQWAKKTQTATLNYSTDGGKNYKTTNPSTTSSTFTLSSSNLPEGTNAVKVTFSSKSNQVGCQKIEMTYVE